MAFLRRIEESEIYLERFEFPEAAERAAPRTQRIQSHWTSFG